MIFSSFFEINFLINFEPWIIWVQFCQQFFLFDFFSSHLLVNFLFLWPTFPPVSRIFLSCLSDFFRWRDYNSGVVIIIKSVISFFLDRFLVAKYNVYNITEGGKTHNTGHCNIEERSYIKVGRWRLHNNLVLIIFNCRCHLDLIVDEAFIRGRLNLRLSYNVRISQRRIFCMCYLTVYS